MAFRGRLQDKITSCRFCLKEFSHSAYIDRIYCSKSCKDSDVDKMRIGRPKLSTGTSGAINELIVSADLMSKGFEVFRSLSPNASCDLMILYKQVAYRVEITCGYRGASRIVCPTKSKFKYDILAVVLRSGGIHYEGLPLVEIIHS